MYAAAGTAAAPQTPMRLALAAALSVCLLGGAAHAQSCPDADGSPGLEGLSVDARLEWLGTELEHELRRINAWSATWGSIYAATTAAQLIAASSLPAEHPSRPTLWLGAGASAFGTLTLTLLPLRLTVPMSSLRDAKGTPCEQLVAAEHTLFRAAQEQRMATGWLGHAGNVAVNLALGLVIAFGFGQWQAGLLAGAIGIAVGEANLLTQPANLSRIASDYREGRWAQFPQ
jgi:hypothetical protein